MLRRPACAALALLLLFIGIGRAENRWPDERDAGQFRCHADFPLAPLSANGGLLDELTQLTQDLHVKLGAVPPRETVHFFLFQAKDTYQSYMKQYFPRVPYRRALFI